MNTRNYQKEMETVIADLTGRRRKARLLLHACCAPCASTCLLRLYEAFAVTVFYYNPNITDAAEYQKRVAELKRLIGLLNEEYASSIEMVEGDYEPEAFFAMAKGLEAEPEGGIRCFSCYEQRLAKTAALAKEGGFDYFATTLTLSPLKNAAKLNEIGERLSESAGVAWLPSDFKKKDGYRESIALSEKYGLYRQNYCGCVYSKNP
ncbi:MAG: epoxyqueuosine reductase QueH [Lachnospiraceae bacterium]|nr:epoxyqueuosine reductase QueH [Lachnospiraceae bacterium]